MHPSRLQRKSWELLPRIPAQSQRLLAPWWVVCLVDGSHLALETLKYVCERVPEVLKFAMVSFVGLNMFKCLRSCCWYFAFLGFGEFETGGLARFVFGHLIRAAAGIEVSSPAIEQWFLQDRALQNLVLYHFPHTDCHFGSFIYHVSGKKRGKQQWLSEGSFFSVHWSLWNPHPTHVTNSPVLQQRHWGRACYTFWLLSPKIGWESPWTIRKVQETSQISVQPVYSTHNHRFHRFEVHNSVVAANAASSGVLRFCSVSHRIHIYIYIWIHICLSWNFGQPRVQRQHKTTSFCFFAHVDWLRHAAPWSFQDWSEWFLLPFNVLAALAILLSSFECSWALRAFHL